MTSTSAHAECPTVPLIRRRPLSIPGAPKSGILPTIREFLMSAADGLLDVRSLTTVAMVCTLFFASWRAAGLLLNCDSPLVVVLSGSMEPAYYRGDLLLLHKITPPVISDVIVFSLPGRTVPIVHRVHRVHEDGGARLFLTKGDNNDFDDRTLYPEGFEWVKEEHIIGKVLVIVPRAGFLTILAEGRPWVKGGVLLAAVIWGWITTA